MDRHFEVVLIDWCRFMWTRPFVQPATVCTDAGWC